MKKYFIGGLLSFLILFGLSYGLIKAADVEIILGTSSAFNVVRGTDVSSGTKMVYVGSSTVSIGTTTQSAMLTVAGSSTDTAGGLRVTNSSGTVTLNVRNDGAVFIGTNTSTLNSALYVGSATSGSLGTITAGFLSIGTISANANLHGTTTVRFLTDIFANGTITAGTKFVGDGSLLNGVTATSFTGGGTISAGSTTVSTLTTTGSTTVTGTLTAGGGNFAVDTSLNRAVIDFNTVGIGTNTPSSKYMLQVTDSANPGFVVGGSGSITAQTLTVTGTATIRGTTTVTGGSLVAQQRVVTNLIGAGTTTPNSNYLLQATDSADLGVVIGSSGTITAKTLTITGSATVTGTLTAAVEAGSSVGIGTTTPSASYRLQVTDDANLGFVVGNNGSITAKAITATGSATLTGPVLIGTNTPSLGSALYVGSSTTGNLGTMTAGFLSVGTITANLGLHGTTTVHFPGGINVTGPKSFLIPHPDPEKKGWLLRHCSVESPTRGDNLYRYKIVIQSDGGEASFSLPTYWTHLNEDPEVWVSAVGQFAQGYGYVDEVTNTLVIKGEKKGIYRVLLIGTRKDLYAKEFDARGVEFADYEMSELLTRGKKKDAATVQVIDTHNNHVTKNFLDPIVDEFGLVTHQ